MTLFFLLLPSALQAQFAYTTNVDDTITITEYTGIGGDVVIPTNIEDKVVTVIGENLFLWNDTVTNVTFSSGITNIGPGAFLFCHDLEAIVVSTNNSYYSSLNGVLFNKSQQVLLNYPGGKGGDYSIPTGVTNIIGDAFRQSFNLTGVEFPQSVSIIGVGAFQDCTGLTNAVLSEELEEIGAIAFAGCYNLTNIKFPTSLTHIGHQAFHHCAGFTEIIIPDQVTYLGFGAFQICWNLTNAVIGNGLTNIESQTFESCINLESIDIPDGVATIGERTFWGCFGLSKVTVPASAVNIGSDAFMSCHDLTGVYFMGDVVAFEGSSIFSYSTASIVYRLPEAIGWPTVPDPWSERPTALWLPEALDDGSLGEMGGQFGFNIGWARGMTAVVDSCTSLVTSNWVPVVTNVFSNSPSYFIDPHWNNLSNRFYRLRSQ